MRKHHYRITVDIKTNTDLSQLYGPVLCFVKLLNLPPWIRISIDNARALNVLRQLSWSGHEFYAERLAKKMARRMESTPGIRELHKRISMDKTLSGKESQ